MRYVLVVCASQARNAIVVAATLLFCVCFPFPLYAQVTVTQTDRILPFDLNEGKHLGKSVALFGDTGLVGAGNDDLPIVNGTLIDAGSAYLVREEAGILTRTKLTASDAASNHHFGWSVALSGDLALIGARQGPAGGTGAAYLFNTPTANEVLKLTASDGSAADEFGWSVALSGNTALIGAPNDQINGVSLVGSAYLFNTSTGQEITKLTASDGGFENQFGYAVGLSGNLAVVGAPRPGVAYVFDTTTGQEITKLVADDGVLGFGTAIAVSGNLALVGSYLQGNERGAVYVFNALTGEQLAKFTASDVDFPDHFGTSISLSGNLALIGSPQSFLSGSRRGSAYLFDLSDLNNIRELAKFTSAEGQAGDVFGNAVALSGNTALVGAELEDSGPPLGNQGAAYLFSFSSASSAAPEPGTLAFLAMPLLAVGLRRFRA